MALKTVPEYLESIRDGREVYLDGKKVEDVTTHPILKNLAEYASAEYEMALDPQYQDLLTEYNGLERVPHVRDKLSWLVMWVEGTEALGRAAVENFETDAESDTVYPNFSVGLLPISYRNQSLAGKYTLSIDHSHLFQLS